MIECCQQMDVKVADYMKLDERPRLLVLNVGIIP